MIIPRDTFENLRERLRMVAPFVPAGAEERHLEEFRDSAQTCFAEALYDEEEAGEAPAFNFGRDDQDAPHEALRLANENSAAQHADHEYALHWDPIKQGVQAASRTRVRELTEDMGWVPIAFEPLQSKQVPIEQADIADRWRDADLPKKLEAHQQEQEQQEQRNNVSTGPRDHSTERLIQELIELGVMTRRKNNMLDVPDIYRIHFDLGRKGGVPRVQSR